MTIERRAGATSERMETVNTLVVVLEDTWSGLFVIRVIQCDTLNIVTGHFFHSSITTRCYFDMEISKIKNNVSEIFTRKK